MDARDLERGVKSEFTKAEIRKRHFSRLSDREYISDLVKLEKFIVEGVHNMGSGLGFHRLKIRRPKEYLALLAELDQKGHAAHMRELREEAKEGRRAELWAEREERKKLRREREWWLAVGGKP